jgi:hypothetical protein
LTLIKNNFGKLRDNYEIARYAEIRTPQQANPERPQKYDLVGFGAVIASGKHPKRR